MFPSFFFLSFELYCCSTCFCSLDFYCILCYLRRVYILSLSPEWAPHALKEWLGGRYWWQKRHDLNTDDWGQLVWPMSFSHRTVGGPDSKCQEGLTKFQEKNYLEHTEAILWNTQINPPSLERQTNIRIRACNINCSWNKSSSDDEKKESKSL